MHIITIFSITRIQIAMANTDSSSPTIFNVRKTPTFFIIIVLLCIASYFLAAYHQGAPLLTTATTASLSLSASCNHHTAQSSRTFPRCRANFSEYTPCEDPQRSLGYKRHRMIYRERHCPEEPLKCRVPAPHGYRNPFPWPASRDRAWFANVPHRELTVEKAVQNWIRFEGERFVFPGGGTTFPNGADAYIEDIGKLINLRDGSIRTALDTGCGVINLLSLFSPLLFLILINQLKLTLLILFKVTLIQINDY